MADMGTDLYVLLYTPFVLLGMYYAMLAVFVLPFVMSFVLSMIKSYQIWDYNTRLKHLKDKKQGLLKVS